MIQRKSVAKIKQMVPHPVHVNVSRFAHTFIANLPIIKSTVSTENYCTNRISFSGTMKKVDDISPFYLIQKMDYKKIKDKCLANGRLSEMAIDNFIMHYGAFRNGLDREFDARQKPYKHLNGRFPEGSIGRLKAQYIVHRIFKDDGLIRKYLNHSEVKALASDVQMFLHEQSGTPWRFAFSYITDNPAPDFYVMVDIFRDEKFLLYSPGVSANIAEGHVMVWSNLIAYNGECWQSFGPIGAFRGFDNDDIFFFATEVNPDIESEEDVVNEVEKNPLPFMMLLSNSNAPLVNSRGFDLVHLQATYEADNFPDDKAKSQFDIEWSDGVYMAKLKDWAEPPHYATLYFHEPDGELQLSALTVDGFDKLVKATRKLGFEVDDEPMIRLHPSMHSTIELILKRKVDLFPYASAFKKVDDGNNDTLNRINMVLKWAMGDLNNDRDPDLRALAEKAGLVYEDVREVLEGAAAHVKKVRKG